MKNDIGILAIPYDEIDKFKELLVSFYETDDTTDLKTFFREKCLLLNPEYEEKMKRYDESNEQEFDNIEERSPRL